MTMAVHQTVSAETVKEVTAVSATMAMQWKKGNVAVSMPAKYFLSYGEHTVLITCNLTRMQLYVFIVHVSPCLT